MKLFNHVINKSKGFTLIELLIVIALIGALAVGLLAALDPIEQINRGRDSATQSMASEYIKAQERYFANNNGTYAGANIVNTVTYLNTLAGAGGEIETLVSNGELKSTFQSSAAAANGSGTKIVVYNKNGATPVFEVSFLASSKAFKTNTNLNRCTTVTGGCTACTATTATCYIRMTY